MHRPALARSQWRPIGTRRARTRPLENRLSWYWASRSWTHRGSRWRTGRTRRRGWSQRRLIHRTRPSLRNDHSWRRNRQWWRTRGCRSGRHSWRLWRRRRGPQGCCGWHRGTGCGPRSRNWWNRGPWRRRNHRRSGLSGSGRCRSRKAGSWSRSRNYKFRRSRRRGSRRLRRGNGRRWYGRDRRLGLDGRRSLRLSIRSRGPLLLADDGF